VRRIGRLLICFADESNCFPRVFSSATLCCFVVLFLFDGVAMVRSVFSLGCSNGGLVRVLERKRRRVFWLGHVLGYCLGLGCLLGQVCFKPILLCLEKVSTCFKFSRISNSQ
jgi:hypothetical protein